MNSDILEITKELAVTAGQAILKIYADYRPEQTQLKADNSPLTQADLVSNRIIVNGLKTAFPTYAILSEEEKDSKERLQNDYCFVIDPLDGTKEFIKKNGEFTVNIALAYKGEAQMGVIYAPVLNELYFAQKGKGAWLQTQNGTLRQLKVSERTQNLRAVASRSHQSDALLALFKKHNITNFVEMGSSLKGCLVAKGEADVYIRYNPTMEWDTAAMQCIVEEAGGIFRQLNHTPMRYNRENSLNDKGFYAINSEKNKLV